MPDTPILGAKYSATRNTDGTYTVHGVPIFSECVDERSNSPFCYDDNWLDTCVERLNKLQAKGHFKPIHYGHHDGMENRQEVGVQMNHRRGWLDGFGSTIFCDLARVPAETVEEMKRGRLAHRSVEIPNPRNNDAVISSLALLSSQDPFHEYPNLYVEEVEEAGIGEGIFCKTRGDAVFVLTPYDREYKMPKKRKFQEQEKEQEQQQQEAPAQPAPAAPAAAPAPAPAPAQPQPMMGVTMEQFQQLQQQVQQLQQMVQSVLNSRPQQPAQPAATAQMAKGHIEMFAQQQADLDRLKKQLQNRSIDENVERFMRQVQRQGLDVDHNDVRTSATKFAKMGPEALETYANSILRNSLPSPIHQPSPYAVAEGDPALKAYEGDPEVYRFAKQSAQIHRQNRQSLNSNERDFIEGQVLAKFPHYRKQA